MKTVKRICAVLLAVLLLGALAASASAENYAEANQAAGGTTSFDKTLIVDEGAKVPGVTFAYTIKPGAAVEAADGKLAVLAGLGTPTVGTAAFTNSDTDSVTVSEGQASVKKSVQIDFSSVTFPEPGVYRYILTETASNLAYITDDSTADRTVDVYVEDSDGKLSVTGYVMYEGAVTAAPGTDGTGAGETKSSGYTNTAVQYDLTLSKTVAGNQGSKDKYFLFTVTVTGIAGDQYTVDLTGADATVAENAATKADYVGKTNPDVVSSGTAAQFYLQHGQSIVIRGLPKGAAYTITETAEDYTASYKVDTVDAVESASCTSGEGGVTADTTVAFTNTRVGTVPTGILLTVIPGVVIVAVAAVGLVLFGRKKREER